MLQLWLLIHLVYDCESGEHMERIFGKPEGTFQNGYVKSWLHNNLDGIYAPNVQPVAILNAICDTNLNRARLVALCVFNSYGEYRTQICGRDLRINYMSYNYDTGSVTESDFTGLLANHNSGLGSGLEHSQYLDLGRVFCRQLLCQATVDHHLSIFAQQQQAAATGSNATPTWARRLTGTARGGGHIPQSTSGASSSVSSYAPACENPGSDAYVESSYSYLGESRRTPPIYGLMSSSWDYENPGSGAKGASTATVEVSCNACTFLNSNSATACDMCGSALSPANPEDSACSRCTYANPASALTCRMCNNPLQQRGHGTSRTVACTSYHGAIVGDGKNRNRGQYEFGNEILPIPRASSAVLDFYQKMPLQQIDDALTQRSDAPGSYSAKETAKDLAAIWPSIKFPGEASNFLTAVECRQATAEAKEFISAVKHEVTMLLSTQGVSPTSPIKDRTDAHLESFTRSVIAIQDAVGQGGAGYLDTNNGAPGNFIQQQYQNEVLRHVEVAADSGCSHSDAVRAAHADCTRLDPTVIDELTQVTEPPSMRMVGTTKVPTSEPVPSTVPCVMDLTFGDMFQPEVSGLICTAHGFVWWVLGVAPGWHLLGRTGNQEPYKNVLILRKIMGVVRMKQNVINAKKMISG